MPLKGCTFTGPPNDYIYCNDNDGNHCWVRSAEMAREDFNHFRHTKDPKKRENIHDEILAKLTDDVNNLIREAEKKKTDRRIGILHTPNGPFFRYEMNEKPSKELLAKGTVVTDENVEELLDLTD